MSISVVIVGCGARGGETYGRYFCRQGHKVVALCDNNGTRLASFAAEFGVEDSKCFFSYDDLFKCGKIADVCVVAVFDQDHFDVAIKAMALGYHLLLEKPISSNIEECLAIRNFAQSHNLTVAVCHVMRYTSYYRFLKHTIDSGVLGKLMGVEQTEDVAYWHMAHAFVRGNFRNSLQTSPMILQKCCHDMDLLVWLTGQKPNKISSMGSLRHFTRQNAPEGSAERCVNCKVEGCPFNACTFYLENFRKLQQQGLPTNVWPYAQVAVNPTLSKLQQALQEGAWGRCVFKCDNNVVDHQWTLVQFDNGLVGTLTMCGFSANGGRQTHVYGTQGEAFLDEQTQTISVSLFGGGSQVTKFSQLADDFSGHGGGDKVMLDEFVSAIEGKGGVDTDIAMSVFSHIMCYCAEKSRLNNGEVVNCSDFI